MNIDKKIQKIFEILQDEIKQNDALKEKIESILKEPEKLDEKPQANLEKAVKTDESAIEIRQVTANERSENTNEQKKKNRREPAILDPIKLVEENKELLKNKLLELDFEKLRDIIAEYGMDPAKLAMKWKNKERIIEHILMTAESRSKKGDAFR
jgi:hypothetical protein